MKLEGKKIKLRYIQPKDAEFLWKNVTNPDVRRTLGNPLLKKMTLEDEKKWIKDTINKRKKKQEVHFTIIAKELDDLVGACGFNKINSNDNWAEIGYWIAKPYWMKGYATDAVKLLISYGFDELKLHRIEAGCFAKNTPSWKIMENIGMKREGTMRKKSKMSGKWTDDYIYSILKSEWKK